MSNTAVGEVYQRIIQEVIDTSLIDFEEAGVSAATLEDLKSVWQQKLSDLHVAHFPWEPAPPPSQQEVPSKKNAQQNATAAQIKKEPGTNTNQQLSNDGPRIKTEPGLEPQGITAPPVGNASLNPQLAAMRAQQNIQQKFGGAAVPMLNQQQQQQQQQRTNGAPKPPSGGLMLPGSVPQQVQQTGSNGIPQHDGADDVENIEIVGFGYITRQQADGIVLEKIKKAQKTNEEFMNAMQSLTLDKGKGKAKGVCKRRREDAYDAALSDETSYPHPSTVPSPSHYLTIPPQLDGGSSEPDEDEDAINSDLDDPEDEEIDNDDDDEVPQIMLCMYDKVQRTKNKWKCVLKDGVLTINGKEYVFHKATGEYEW